MTPQQMIDFDARREAVLREHLKTSPKFRAMRRDKRVAFAAGIVRYAVALGILLFLIKASVMSQNGVDGYMQLVTPILAHVPGDGLLAQAIAPDSYSVMLAESFSEMLASDEQVTTDALDGIERIGPTVTGS